jgi:hypothetical protein
MTLVQHRVTHYAGFARCARFAGCAGFYRFAAGCYFSEMPAAMTISVVRGLPGFCKVGDPGLIA